MSALRFAAAYGSRRNGVLVCVTAAMLALSCGVAAATPIERELHLVATVEGEQTWKKNDPKYPGDQWSKGSTRQRYELTTRLRSDGKLQVRNLLDPDLNQRLEAKTIFLARQAKKYLEQPGQPIRLPRTDVEKSQLMERMQEETMACKVDPVCRYELSMQYAAIMAAIDYPEAMEEDTVPGRYLYFLPYKGCPEQSRVTLTMAIDGIRYNKNVDKFVPFSERRSADTINGSDGLSLCSHFTAVIDTQDAAKPMLQETIFLPSPEGITEYTENGRTSRTTELQPMPSVVLDWMNEVLRHATASGSASVSLPLTLPLNGNSTWLGQRTGTAKISMQWSFKEVPAVVAK